MSKQAFQKEIEKMADRNRFIDGKMVSKDDLVTFTKSFVKSWQNLESNLSKRLDDAVLSAKQSANSVVDKFAEHKKVVVKIVNDAVKSESKRTDKEIERSKKTLLKEIDLVNSRIPSMPNMKPLFNQLKKSTNLVAKVSKDIPKLWKTIGKLWDEIEKLQVNINNMEVGGITQVTNMASQAGRDLFVDIDLSDQLDGSTKTFNIQATYNILTVDLSSYPYGSLRKGIDYTWTPTSITFTDEIVASTQLASGQKCILTTVAS